MRILRIISTLGVSVCLSFIMLYYTCMEATAKQPTKKNPIELKACHAYPAGDYLMHVLHGYFKEAVEKHTDGRVKVTIYPMSQLFPIKEEVSALSLGSIDFATTPNVFLAGTFPGLRILEIPFVFEDDAHRRRWFLAAHDKLSDMYAKKGIKYLTDDISGLTWYGIWNSKRPITKMEDWKGLKMRAGSAQKLALEAWGASGILIPSAELPTALQQGMIDGGIHTVSLVVKTPLYPYLKYGSSEGRYIFNGAAPLLMSMKTWNRLPEDIQHIIETKVLREVTWRVSLWGKKDVSKLYKKLEKEGMKLEWFEPGEIDKMLAAYKPVLEKKLKKWGPLAMEFWDLVQATR